MKKTYKTKIILLGIIFIYPNLLLSHGGGLNKYGCHNETKTGGYHCHRAPGISPTSPTTPGINTYSPNSLQNLTSQINTKCKITIGDQYYEFKPSETNDVNINFKDSDKLVNISCK